MASASSTGLRSRSILKWVGVVLGGLVGLLALAFVVLYVIGGAKLGKTYTVPVESVSIPTDAAAVQRGQRLAVINLCTRCHGADLSGTLDFDVPGLVTIPTANLTAGAGGIGTFYTDADWVRAIRHGVGRDGRGLFIMPTQAFHSLSDEDLGAVIAYVRSRPPVDNQLPPRSIGPLGRVMAAVGMFPPPAVEQIDHNGPRPMAVERGVTVAYGRYLTRTCTECHGADLNGAPFGPPGQQVPTPNLTPGGELAAWSEKDFFTTLRTGRTPSGQQLDKEMPWMYYGQMTDEELRAVWLYLQSLPALKQGG
ncbi:MAG: cytochrome c [Anaerolineae bacterium]